MDALFVTTRADRPSHRFRVEQILPAWRSAGHTAEVAVLPKSPIARLWQYRNWSRFDVVLIQQRTFSPWELGWLRRSVRRLVFDVDDAVMFASNGDDDRRRMVRFEEMIRQADAVICGNRNLARLCERECRSTNSKVTVIPTAIDTARFQPRLRANSSGKPPKTVIGWTGSHSTAPYLNAILPAIAQLPPEKVRVKFIADRLDGVDLSLLGPIEHEFIRWSAETEVAETAEFDIGLMPVPNNRFTQGKCGCKALQYMALGIPSVVSPVGVNCEIVQPGQNGFLADTQAEWHQSLLTLVNDAALRERIGWEGRRTVEAEYSIALQGQRVVHLLEGLRKAA